MTNKKNFRFRLNCPLKEIFDPKNENLLIIYLLLSVSKPLGVFIFLFNTKEDWRLKSEECWKPLTSTVGNKTVCQNILFCVQQIKKETGLKQMEDE